MHLNIKSTDKKLEIASTMTDISFLLIIFFIVAAVFFADKGIFLILPEKEEKPLQLRADEVIDIKLPKSGLTVIDGKEVKQEEIKTTVKKRLLVKPGLVVILEVDGGVKYQRVLSVIEESKRGGAKRYSIISVKKKPVPVKLADKPK